MLIAVFPHLFMDFSMKKNFKNTTIFNYQYLDTLAEYLSKETIDQESKIALLRRLLSALHATEQGEKHDHYKFLKKNLTEHKALEYIIERLVKKEYPALQAMPIDYSAGIFEVFRLHKDAIKLAVVSIIERELKTFSESVVPTIDTLQKENHFDHYSVILNNLIEIRNLAIKELEPLITKSCELAMSHICTLCDALKDAFKNNLIKDSKQAMVVHYLLEQNQEIIGEVWGRLRLAFLIITVRTCTMYLMQKEKESAPAEVHTHEHNDSCHCHEHNC
jgi:hypothetical protein